MALKRRYLQPARGYAMQGQMWHEQRHTSQTSKTWRKHPRVHSLLVTGGETLDYVHHDGHDCDGDMRTS